MSLEKILIIDDEPIVCKALREILPKKRFTVSMAGMIARGESAQGCRKPRPGCVCAMKSGASLHRTLAMHGRKNMGAPHL